MAIMETDPDIYIKVDGEYYLTLYMPLITMYDLSDNIDYIRFEFYTKEKIFANIDNLRTTIEEVIHQCLPYPCSLLAENKVGNGLWKHCLHDLLLRKEIKE